jgi:chromosome segregation ATPase
LQIVDLAQELWRRALAAAVLETRLGTTSRNAVARTAEVETLRLQLSSVRDQLQRESLAYGELRAQAARHEVIAREALSREQNSAMRERELVRQVGTLQQRIAELEATLNQRRGVTRSLPPKKAPHKLRKPSKKLRPMRRRNKRS